MFLQALLTTDSLSSSDLKLANEQLKVIEQKISDKTTQLSEPTTFAGAKQLTRHEMDLEKAVTRDRDSTRVFRCLVTDKSSDSVDPDHPINHLDQIWKDVLSSKPTCRRRKRKWVAAAVASDAATCEVTSSVSSGSGIVSEESVSNCLQREQPVKSPSDGRLLDVLTSRPTCRRRKRKRAAARVTGDSKSCEVTTDIGSGSVSVETVSNCLQHEEPVKPQSDMRLQSTRSSDDYKQRKCDIEPVPVEVIERYRLSTEQIRQLPRFQNYSAGTPSPVCSLFFSDFSSITTELIVGVWVWNANPGLQIAGNLLIF